MLTDDWRRSSMRKILLLLTTVFLLTGCSESKPIPETGPSTTPTAQNIVLETQAIPTTEETTQPTEPPLPWDSDARWYPTYYFDKRPNPDPNIVEGVVRFNALFQNEERKILTIQSAHADFYLGTEIVAQEEFDSERLPDFLPHPRFGDLEMEYGESIVLQLYSTEQERGSYDRVIVTYTLADADDNQTNKTFHFAVNEEDVTPYSFSDRTDWSPVNRTEFGWDFCCAPENTTDETMEFVGIHHTTFQDGLPMDSFFIDKDKYQFKGPLGPGQISVFQSGISHQFNASNEREITMVFKDESGQRYLQTFRFALAEEYCIGDNFTILQAICNKKNLQFMNTPDKIQQELGAAQYTRQEIRQMIDAGLSLEELAEKLSTVYDVQQYFLEAGIGFTNGDIKQYFDGIQWHFNDSPQVVLRQNSANCGSGSGLINYLLQGDYEEQGYLHYAANLGGHIFNYFRSGDRFYIWDWTMKIEDRFTVIGADCLEDFASAYIAMNQTTAGSAGKNWILLLYAYPYEGSHRPSGSNSNVKTVSGAPAMNMIPTEIEKIVQILYLDAEKYAPVFVEAPPVSQWPEDAQ